MKKLLAILAIGTLLVGCSPEAAKAQTYPLTTANISIVNSGTSYLSAQPLNQHYNTLAIQVTATKLSGVTFSALSYLQGSNDGTNYYTLPSTIAPTFSISTASTQTHVWKLEGNPYYYYRVKTVGTYSLMCGTESGLILPRR